MDDSSPIVDHELLCPDCGYNLRSIQSDRCPECGLTIDRTILGESIIPWLHRQKLRRFRAFWKTVNMMTFRPRQLARELARPARFADAVKFRRAVVRHALIPVGLLLTGLYLGAISDWTLQLWHPEDRLGSLLQLLAVPIGWICLGSFLFAITGVASYFFHPSSLSVIQQNRAVALSYYACAPLAYTPLVLAMLIACLAGVEMIGRRQVLLQAFFFILAYLPLLVQLVAWHRGTVVLLQVSVHNTGWRPLAMGVVLPVAWGLLGLLLLVIVPAGCVMLGIMLVSLQS